MDSAYLTRNIQFFIKKGGFGIMLELLQAKEQKIDMLSAKWIMKSIVRVGRTVFVSSELLVMMMM